MTDAGTDLEDGGPHEARGCDAPASAIEDVWTADPDTCFVHWASDVGGARGLAFAPNGDLFVVTRGGIVVLWDADGDGVSGPTERSVFATSPEPNHGIAFHDGYLYASSATQVFRWTYASGQRAAEGSAEVVVRDLPSGGHSSRTLMFQPDGKLLVSIGSAGNVDFGNGEPLPTRALVRRYDVTNVPEGGIPAGSGEVFASGLRNEVGLTLDANGRVWGVENGRDQLVVGGADIHENNPAEELHRFASPDGAFYGYPYCWTQYDWPGHGERGTQHVDPDVPGGHDDAWCQDPENNRPPAAALPAHLAPLDLVFADDSVFPTERGTLFITSHGSWNREDAAGRMILRAVVDESGAVLSVTPFLGEKAANGELVQGSWKYRPVDIALAPDGTLYVSDDSSGTVHRIGRR